MVAAYFLGINSNKDSIISKVLKWFISCQCKKKFNRVFLKEESRLVELQRKTPEIILILISFMVRMLMEVKTGRLISKFTQ